jgi:hypothetical protein
MEQRLTTQQLERIVGEVGRLADRQQAELDRSEVQKILEELNLPPELLDEAIIQVQRKEALARQQQLTKRVILASIITVAIIVVGTSLFWQNRSVSIAKVNASQDRITLATDNSANLQAVRTGSDLVYRTTLNNAPVGEKLNITCNWLDPAGKIAHINRYETKNITTPIWNTQCRYQLPISATNGRWQVEIRLGDRVLQQAPFDVN